jgi:hypothetical protein
VRPPASASNAHHFFIRLFIKALQEQYKDHIEAIILAIDATPTKLMKGVAINKALCLAIIPTCII